MDELPAADVDAHMGNAAGICIREEHDVTGLEIGLFNESALTVLIGGGAVRGEAQLLQNVVHEAGAVKTAGGGAAVNVGRAQILLRFRHDG